ncbi:THUMP domain-containing protein 1 homolog, partial [Morus notabilis]|uniref:THUMP domain-containing protein 1 homolog n=1 Tax=Morus notabilis TaxID=981085 RepID=UPI000CED0111
FEELVLGKDSDGKLSELHSKPLNKKIKFSYSDSSDIDDDEDEEEEDEEEKETGAATSKEGGASNDNARSETLDPNKHDDSSNDEKEGEANDNKEGDKSHEIKEAEEPPAKKQCSGKDAPKAIPDKVEEKSVDKLIEAEVKELADKSKRRFFHLDTGCNGVVFVQMQKRDGDPCPKDIVQHIMTCAAATRKHVSRFILRILPIELACYASEEEISKAIVPIVEQYFPVETENPQKFAVLYGARANTGIDRMKIIDAVAKSVPKPHKVDLSNPDKAIVVEIVK